ncbi:acyl-CoA thioesterase [Bacteriovorax sp. Seq25_V]|uniref:acyl-CoA thioesterase n=1 Tax=Bacteriovorax sp. Seq25_V TaxID=1201288 RepID=UPI00038A17C7|nr:acyl-CoA thioesterase [Bacteriovorax sp. Seq25_V]EQC43785.1 acyl-CoA thioester hydrolase YciA [Bacteriovorax sp. Seq25_V]
MGKKEETKKSSEKKQVSGELCVRTLAMPGDTNPNGDIFGGWVLSQMDIAGGIFSGKHCHGRTVTVAIESMTFLKPVLVGDVLCCYCDLIKEGNSSITLKIEAWTIRRFETERVLVTEGVFTYVAVDEERRPRSIHSFSTK